MLTKEYAKNFNPSARSASGYAQIKGASDVSSSL